MYSCGPPHMDVQEWDDQHELTYSNYVRTQDVTLKTCRRRWMIGRDGERGSGISALAARHDDDDEMQSVLSRIWTCVAKSISYDDNHYTTGTYKDVFICISYTTWKYSLLHIQDWTLSHSTLADRRMSNTCW